VRDYVKEKTGRKIHLFPTDLKEEKNCIASVKSCVQEFGKIDILVNNAAQQLENHDITTLDSKQWEDTFQVSQSRESCWLRSQERLAQHHFFLLRDQGCCSTHARRQQHHQHGFDQCQLRSGWLSI
jgi:NAD(P)-dependent dehydrogenase (short-subunit alcohol dehydrogenase family)